MVPLGYTNRALPGARWQRAWRALSSLLFGAYPGER